MSASSKQMRRSLLCALWMWPQQTTAAETLCVFVNMLSFIRHYKSLLNMASREQLVSLFCADVYLPAIDQTPSG